MSYQSQSELYRNPGERNRMEMCAREQAYIFAAQTGPAAALGQGVVGGDMQDIDALIAGCVVGPNGAALANDPDLLAAMQAVWPTVATARYPGTPA